MKPPSIVIASRIPPGTVGGLANYQWLLGQELEARGLAKVTFFNGKEPAGWVRQGWMSMASRPAFHPLLERWIAAEGFASFSRELKEAQAIHFVGTGWDFRGFAVSALAKKIGARFTIWPAVHPGQWGDDRIDLRLYREADAVFCQSQSEAAHLVARGLDPGRSVICGLPPMCRADGDGERLRRAQEIGDRPAVLFLGNRIESKGYPALLAAWAIVLKAFPDAVLLLAGPGGEDHVSLLQSLPIGSYRDLGVVDEQGKADAYAACDVFCLPSAHESFGIVYVEAWSYGKPVVCGPAPASREWVKDGKNGLYAEQKPEAIAEALERLLGDDPMRLRLGEAGRDFQRNNLTWDKIIATHLEAFKMSGK